jgi:hypothetical protein
VGTVICAEKPMVADGVVGRIAYELFPAFASTESRLSAQTHEHRASLCQAKRHGLTSPTEEGCGQQGGAPTVLQRHLGLKGAPLGAGHLGGRQA